MVLTTLAPKLLLLTQPDAQKGTLRKSSATRKTPAIAPKLCKTAVQDDLPSPHAFLPTPDLLQLTFQRRQSELLTIDQNYKTVAQKQGVSEVSRLFRKPKTFELAIRH